MVYFGRKNDNFLNANLSGKRPKEVLVPRLKNAYDEVERLLIMIEDNQGFSFFLIDLLIKIINQ